MSLTLKKQNAIKQFLTNCYEIYQVGYIDEEDFNDCAEQILSLWNKKVSCSTNEKYPCGCSRGRGRPKSDCKLMKCGKSHKDYKNMSESEMLDFYNKVINSDNTNNVKENNCIDKKYCHSHSEDESEAENEDEISDEEEDADIFLEINLNLKKNITIKL